MACEPDFPIEGIIEGWSLDIVGRVATLTASTSTFRFP